MANEISRNLIQCGYPGFNYCMKLGDNVHPNWAAKRVLAHCVWESRQAIGSPELELQSENTIFLAIAYNLKSSCEGKTEL